VCSYVRYPCIVQPVIRFGTCTVMVNFGQAAANNYGQVGSNSHGYIAANSACDVKSCEPEQWSSGHTTPCRMTGVTLHSHVHSGDTPARAVGRVDDVRYGHLAACGVVY